jgi:hypothetical protein
MRTWLARILTRCLLVFQQLLSCCIGVHNGGGNIPVDRPPHHVESLPSQTTEEPRGGGSSNHSTPSCFNIPLRSVKSSNDPIGFPLAQSVSILARPFERALQKKWLYLRCGWKEASRQYVTYTLGRVII